MCFVVAYAHLGLSPIRKRPCWANKTDDPFVPEDIRAKINGLQSLLDHAADLYSDIYSWYDSELKSYDPKATADDELFDPGTGTVVEGIDYLSIMESLSELQTANECKMQRD